MNYFLDNDWNVISYIDVICVSDQHTMAIWHYMFHDILNYYLLN